MNSATDNILLDLSWYSISSIANAYALGEPTMESGDIP